MRPQTSERGTAHQLYDAVKELAAVNFLHDYVLHPVLDWDLRVHAHHVWVVKRLHDPDLSIKRATV